MASLTKALGAKRERDVQCSCIALELPPCLESSIGVEFVNRDVVDYLRMPKLTLVDHIDVNRALLGRRRNEKRNGASCVTW